MSERSAFRSQLRHYLHALAIQYVLDLNIAAETIQLIFQHIKSHPGNVTIEDFGQRLFYGELEQRLAID
jgi:hypothetical protein